MKITIFGGTGVAGKLTVDQARRAGHEVTVYVRNPDKVSSSGEVRIVKGELVDKQAISGAIADQDAIISLLGPTGKSTGMPISDGMRNIVEAMQAHGVMRLIATATPSASDPHDRFSLSFWLAIRMIRALAGTAYADIVAETDVIRRSQLDWTIVRLPWLISKSNEKPAVAGFIGEPRIKLFYLSRDRLAEFLVKQLADRSWIRKAPAISNG